MDIQKREEFRKVVYRFFRDNDDVDAKQMAEMLKSLFVFYATDHSQHRGGKYDDMRERLSEDSVKDFRALWDEFVQKSIDFVRNHDDVKRIIEEERQDIIREWNPDAKEDGEFLMQPDLQLSFGVDGLDASVEYGEWVLSTDSSMCLRIGNRSVIDMM